MRSLLIVALLAIASAASACDVCGCSIGGNYFGILPQFHKHFVGLRWSGQSYQSAHSLSAARSGLYDSDEQFNTIDLMGRFYPVRRVQVLLLAPYHDFRRVDKGVYTHNQGIGDFTAMGNYILIDSGDSLRHKWKHTLTVGGGIKLPTGRYEARDKEGQLLLENMQAGSGSTDFILSAGYTVRRGKWGISSDLMGRLNTRNKNDYYFGNRVSGSAKLFYLKNFKGITLLPNVGLFAEVSEASYDGHSRTVGTGGTLALSTFGLDVYLDKVSFGYTYQAPVYAELGGGKIKARNRWMATLNYNF